jgi:hypothetical protein
LQTNIRETPRFAMRNPLHLLMIAVLVLSGGCTQIRHFGETLGGKNALWAAKKMEDPDFPDERREGINFLVDHSYGKQPPYTTRYKQIAQNDPDFTVRAAAIRALNRARDKTATPVFIKALNDSKALVRLEAAKALSNIPDPAAMEPLRKLVSDPTGDRDVRIASADALRHYRDMDVARALVSVLNGREFGVAWQARHSLVTITGHDLHYDESAWLNYLTSPASPLG